jgi:hypothetical protein
LHPADNVSSGSILRRFTKAARPVLICGNRGLNESEYAIELGKS